MKSNILLLTLFTLTCSAFAQNKTSSFSWQNLPKISRPTFKADTLSIAKLGAKSDGIFLNTEIINAAITKCSRNGGGTVLIPQGIWLTGPLYLKSNVELHLDRGANLIFSKDKSLYKLIEGDYEGKPAARNESPINGNDLVNVAITGNGIIDANGDVWRAVGQSQLTASQWSAKVASGGVLSDDKKTWYPSEQFKKTHLEGKSMLLQAGKPLESFNDMKDYLRPNLLVLKNCKKVLLAGVTFQNSPAWCIHPLLCEDLTVENVTIKNPHYAQNGDGIDIESCTRFLVENCVLDVGDDAICIKSGKDEEGRKRGVACAEGVIRGNTVYSGHGAVVIGSEMSGGARDIFIENCTFIGTDKGLRFKSTRGRGGVVERIYARNITMKDIHQEAIFFDMFYFVKFATDGKRNDSPIVNEGTPVFKNLLFENITCQGAKVAVFIRGLSEMPVQNIAILNSNLVAEKGIELTDASGIRFDNVGVFTQNKAPLISVAGVRNVHLDKLKFSTGTPLLLSIDGDKNRDIVITNTDLKKANKNLELKNGASEKVVTLSK